MSPRSAPLLATAAARGAGPTAAGQARDQGHPAACTCSCTTTSSWSAPRTSPPRPAAGRPEPRQPARRACADGARSVSRHRDRRQDRDVQACRRRLVSAAVGRHPRRARGTRLRQRPRACSACCARAARWPSPPKARRTRSGRLEAINPVLARIAAAPTCPSCPSASAARSQPCRPVRTGRDLSRSSCASDRRFGSSAAPTATRPPDASEPRSPALLPPEMQPLD